MESTISQLKRILIDHDLNGGEVNAINRAIETLEQGLKTDSVPKDATNGDVIKILFPDAYIRGYFTDSRSSTGDILYVRLGIGEFQEMQVQVDWWNASYKESEGDDMTREEICNSMTLQDAMQVFRDTNCYGTMDIAKSVILQALKEPKTGWIPVSERLPEKDGYYIATIDGEICGEDEPFCGMAEFENGKWVDDEEDYQCIIAWMPLPKPYKVGSEEV